MALTQVAINSRRGIRYAIYFIVFLTIGRILFGVGVSIYQTLFPAPPPAPTVKFGILSKIPFPPSTPTKFNYILETPDGGLPLTKSQAQVYFMPKNNANLLALDVAKEKAKQLGFSSSEIQENEYLYSFTHETLPSILKMNIITKNFSISYDLAADRTPIDIKPPPPEIAASSFKAIISSAQLLPTDITGPVLHNFYKLNNGQLINAISLSESDLVKINLFRKEYDELPSVTANPNQANIWAIMSGAGDKAKQIIASEYHYFAVDETQNSTYPLKTSESAFSELNAGSAYIANIGTNKENDSVKIRRVYLAYYDPDTEADFYQPVFVFEGDNGFVAYIPAVTSEYYGE